MENESAFRIPRRGELVPLGKVGGKVDIKPQIEAALNDDAVIDAIEEYKTNGGIAGDAKIDDVRAMDIILAWDGRHGGSMRGSNLKEAEILQAVNVVLRRRFVLDKKRKIVGLNEKHYKLLTQA
jgi:hypothetical protein